MGPHPGNFNAFLRGGDTHTWHPATGRGDGQVKAGMCGRVQEAMGREIVVADRWWLQQRAARRWGKGASLAREGRVGSVGRMMEASARRCPDAYESGGGRG